LDGKDWNPIFTMKKGEEESPFFDTSRYKNYLEEVKAVNSNPFDLLSISYKNIITDKDSNFYHPKNLNDKPNKFYPTIPFTIKPETLAKFDIDTLFFIFFVQQDPYLQVLVAKRLISLNWMFHKRFQTWFQLVGKAKKETEEQIEGTFYYFDFEKEWQIRTKRDFNFVR